MLLLLPFLLLLLLDRSWWPRPLLLCVSRLARRPVWRLVPSARGRWWQVGGLFFLPLCIGVPLCVWGVGGVALLAHGKWWQVGVLCLVVLGSVGDWVVVEVCVWGGAWLTCFWLNNTQCPVPVVCTTPTRFDYIVLTQTLLLTTNVAVKH